MKTKQEAKKELNSVLNALTPSEYAEYFGGTHPHSMTLKDMDLTKIDNIVIDGIDHKDAPDYCDAFIASADYNGVEMTDKQLNELNDNSEFVYDEVLKSIN